MTRVAIAIGSNLGDRQAHIAFARGRLAAVLTELQVSGNYETDPVGGPEGQGRFLNAAAAGTTALAPRELLAFLLAVERERGRTRPFPLAPRTLDLDLILFGDLVMDGPELSIPHPRFRERAFVLGPLAEVAPDLRDPVTGKTIKELSALIAK